MKVNCCDRVVLNLEELSAVRRHIEHSNDLDACQLHTTPEKLNLKTERMCSVYTTPMNNHWLWIFEHAHNKALQLKPRMANCRYLLCVAAST